MSTLTKEEIENKISNLEWAIKDLRTYLPYADGQAYYQDKQRISTYYTEIAELKKKLEEMDE